MPRPLAPVRGLTKTGNSISSGRGSSPVRITTKAGVGTPSAPTTRLASALSRQRTMQAGSPPV